jgi:hypothetical protein
MHGVIRVCKAIRAQNLLLEVYNSKKVQYNEYDSYYDQSVNPTTCLRKPWTNVPTEKAEQPQYY